VKIPLHSAGGFLFVLIDQHRNLIYMKPLRGSSLLLIIFLLQSTVRAQITFEKMIIDNAGFSYTSGAAVQQTNDGGYIMAGTYRFLLGNEGNSYLVKTNQYGDTVWTKVYRDRDSMEITSAVRQTNDGGYILCGWLRDFENGSCWYIRKTDGNGNSIWVKYFRGVSGDSRPYSVIQTGDGGFAIAGHIDELNAALVKLDANGNTLWTKQYYRNDADQVMQAFSVQQTNDGGFILAGYTPDAWPYYYSGFLLKTDSDGNMQWNKAYNNLAGWFHSVRQTTDGGFVVAGIAGDTVGISDVCLIKTDSAGEIQWSKAIGSSGSEWAGEVNQTHEGGYIVSGISNSFGLGSFNYYLVKADGTGNVEWSKIYDEAADLPHLSYYPPVYCVKETDDNGFIGSGLFYSSVFGYALCMIKTDSLGSAQCSEIDAKPSVTELNNPISTLSVITLSQVDTLDARPYSVSSNGITYTVCLNVNVSDLQSLSDAINIFPNPSSSGFTLSVSSEWSRAEEAIEISIYDVARKEVYVKNVNGTSSVYLQPSLNAGLYTLRIISGERISVKKLIIN
jgi:hypothetical protein